MSRRRPVVQYVAGAVFRGYRPSGRLGEVVQLIWTVQGVPLVPADRVLPNGVVELIINLGSAQRVVHGERAFTRYRRAWVAGLQRGPLDIASERESALVGIRFRPGAAGPVLGLPLSVLTDDVVEVQGGLDRGIGTLRQRLLEAGDDQARLALVETHLTAALAAGPGPDPRVGRAVAVLRRAGPGLSLRGLAATLGASHKHLIGLFRREVGVGPKMLARILRFQRVVRALERGAGNPARARRPFTDLAYQHGYADQAHLSHEFRALAGIPPSAYLAARTVDPNHLETRVARGYQRERRGG